VRVCFVRTDPAPVELAGALEAAGDVEVVVAERPPEGRFDVAIACDWRACGVVFDVDAARRAALVVTLEHRALDPARPERLPALLALDLPLDFLVTSAWVERALADARPGARAWRVALGRPAPAGPPAPSEDGGPLRVAGAAPDVLAAMEEPAEDVPLPGDGASPAPHVVVALPGAADPFARPVSALAPVLAGFAVGATAVAARLEGRDEVVAPDENGLLVEPDDAPGTARTLDRLARDRALLARLREGAARSAEAWPTWEAAGRELVGVLERVLAAEPPSGAPPEVLMRHALAEAAKLAAYESARADTLLARSQALDERETALEARERALEAHPAARALVVARRRWRHPALRPLRAVAGRLRGRHS